MEYMNTVQVIAAAIIGFLVGLIACKIALSRSKK